MHMKLISKLISLLFFHLAISFSVEGQTLRYFEIKTTCYDGINNTWQDSSFIAATSNQVLIDSIYADFARPIALKYHVGGKIDYGNGGYNHNGSHWFLWHYIENQWGIGQGGSIEVQDACPTNVDACVSCFIKVDGYQPWSGYVSREVLISEDKVYLLKKNYSIYPNPVNEKLRIQIDDNNISEIIIYDIASRKLIELKFYNQITINTESLLKGIYIYELRNNDVIIAKDKIIKE